MATIVWIILIFNLLLIVGAIVFYIVRRNNKCEHRDLESFCSELPLDAEVPDPYVLKNGKWVTRDPPESTPDP